MLTFYLWEDHKTLILTTNRTGSSHLFDLSNVYPDKLIRQDRSYNFYESLLEFQNKNYTIYLAIKDPTQRRISALTLMASYYDYIEKNIYYLKGRIKQVQQQWHERALPQYTLRDSHLDWGTSVLYHILKLKGIKVLPLLLNRSDPAWNDHPMFMEPVQFSRYTNHGTIPTLTSITKEILGTESSKFDHGTVLLGEAIHKPNEMGDRHLLYDNYCLEFRKIIYNLNQEPILTLDEFIGFEHRCHTSIIREHNSLDHYESSEDLIEYITQKFLSHPDMRNVITSPNWPGCTVMLMVDKIKEFMLECVNNP